MSLSSEKGGQKVCPLFFILSIFFLVLTLSILPPAYDYTIIKLFLSGLFAVFFLLFFLINKKRLFFNVFLFSPLFLYYLFFLISLSFSSSPLVSFKQLNISIAFLAIFLIGFNLKEVLSRRWVIYAWIISASIASVWVISQYFREGKIVASFGNRNFFAGYIILPIPILVSSILEKRKDMPFLILALSLLLFSLYITKSQAAFLGFCSSLCFIFFYYLRDKIKIDRKRLFFIFSAIFFLITLFIPRSVSDLVENIRYPLYAGTIRMIKEKPILGFGPGKFETSFQNFRPIEYFGRKETVPISNHAHCEYLEIAAETGIPSLVSFVLFIGFFFFLLDKKLRQGKDWHILAGLGAGVLAVLVDNLLSTNLRTYSVPPFFYLSLGLASSSLAGNKKVSRLLSLLIPILLCIIIIIFIPFGLKEIKSQIYYKKGADCQNKGEIDRAIYFLEGSLEYSPSNLNTFYKLAYLYAISNRPEKSISIYSELLKFSPNFAKVHYNIALILASLGENESASHHLTEALKQDPYDEESLSLLKTIKEGKKVIVGIQEEKRVDRGKLQLYNSQE